MKLDIPLIRQDPKSDDCLRCCMLMVLNYLGDKITKEQVWKQLTVYSKKSGLYGAYFTDVGTIAMKRGFKATIFHGDWTWWNKDCFESISNNKRLVEVLDDLKKQKKKLGDRKIISKEIRYIKNGGVFKYAHPNLEHINEYLERNVPVIISANGAILDENPKDNFIHAIVIIGREREKYIIRDPYKGHEFILADKLLHAWSRHGGWMLVTVK